MAQHDYELVDQSGAAFRADLNGALAAIRTQNSGPTEPSPTYAYQPWADTTTGLMKARNASNTSWVTLHRLDGAFSLVPPADGAVTTARLADGALAASTAGLLKMADGYLAASTAGRAKMADGFVDTSKLASGIAPIVSSINGGPLAGFRNLLINGNPIINQRGYASGTATTGANQYTLDRWRVVVSGQSISWTDSANVRTVTAPAGGVEQVIEGLSIFSGTYALNWTGTATATVGGAAVAKGGTFTLTGGTNTTVRFSSGTFSLAQLEPGPVATPFERRPIGTELALCQRYFYKTDKGFSLQGYGSSAGANTYAHLTHPVPMRATPTASAAFVSGVNNQSQTITPSAQAFTIQLISIATGEFTVAYSAGNTFSAEL